MSGRWPREQQTTQLPLIHGLLGKDGVRHLIGGRSRLRGEMLRAGDGVGQEFGEGTSASKECCAGDLARQSSRGDCRAARIVRFEGLDVFVRRDLVGDVTVWVRDRSVTGIRNLGPNIR